MDNEKQKKWFKEAYEFGDKRLEAGYGWPLEVDNQLIKFLEVIQKSLSSGKVLDLGCGQGRHTIFFSQKGFDAYGIDYIERAIVEARQQTKERNLDNANFMVMNVLNLDFPKNFFDIVLDWSVLDHIRPKEWKRYLNNILDVLKVGGYLILTEFSANDQRIKDKSKNFSEDENHYDHYFTEEGIEDIFSKNFEVIAINETMLTQPPQHLMINVLMKRKL